MGWANFKTELSCSSVYQKNNHLFPHRLTQDSKRVIIVGFFRSNRAPGSPYSSLNPPILDYLCLLSSLLTSLFLSIAVIPFCDSCLNFFLCCHLFLFLFSYFLIPSPLSWLQTRTPVLTVSLFLVKRTLIFPQGFASPTFILCPFSVPPKPGLVFSLWILLQA